MKICRQTIIQDHFRISSCVLRCNSMKSLPAAIGLLTMLVALSTAQLSFGPEFHLSQYETNESEQLVISLSAPILTSPQTPAFNGSIEVDITAEDLPSGDPRQSAMYGSDYVVNIQNLSSRVFTVVFQSKQANSTEHVIFLAEDNIFEGSEFFRLQIVAARFIGQAAVLFQAVDVLNDTFVDVYIADDDFIIVNWTISQSINVTEGEGVEVRLSGEAFGPYANPISIGVVCIESISTGVEPAFPGKDYNFTDGAKIHFMDTESSTSFSFTQLVIPIINDDIAEPCKSFFCTLQEGAMNFIRVVEPNQVTIKICDDDPLVFRWAQDYYEFAESQVATVELVTNSTFEVAHLTIQAFPRQIRDGHPNHFPSLVLPGPAFQGVAFNATIEQAVLSHHIFGNAQVASAGRTDVVNTSSDFVFTPAIKSAFRNLTIVDDEVLEFDELFIAEFSLGPEISSTWNAKKGEPSIAFILLRDDDSVEVNFDADRIIVDENDGQINVSLRIDGKFFFPVWATVEVSNGTATGSEDFSSAMHFNVTFDQTAFTDGDDPAPSVVSSPTVINITEDDIFEGVEYFQAQIVETSDSIRVRIGQDTVNLTIMDSTVLTVKYEEERYIVEEEAGYVTLALVLDRAAAVPVIVSVNVLDLQDGSVGDPATAQDDYIPRGAFFVTFPPGSRRQVYNVTILDDQTPENSEFFIADIVSTSPSGVIIGSPKLPLIEIIDVVADPPHIQDSPLDLTVNQSSQAIFNCTAHGNPVPTISWTGPGNFTAENTVRTNFTVLSVLTINSAVRALHEGLYTCSANNGIRPSSRSSATLTIQVPPTVRHVQQRVVGLEFLHVTVSFVILDASPAVKTQNINWSFESVHGMNITIPTDSVTATFSNLTGMFSGNRLNLTLTDLSNDFEGTYTMTATNEAGSNSASVPLLIESHPRIIKPPEDLQVVAGVTVTYDCLALAKPLHSLTWYFISANGSNSTLGSVNGTQKMIRHNEKYEITDYVSSRDEYGRLIVRDAQFENRGTYFCIVENRHGPNKASATLSVQVPPMFLSTSGQVNVVINSNDAVTLKCSIRGYPLTTLLWRKNGIPLVSNGSHVNITTFRRLNPTDPYPFSSVLERPFQAIPLEGLEYFEAVSELTLVPPIVRTDTANYTCEVESQFVQNYTETSDNILVNISESTIIQLYLRPVSDCLTWVETNGNAKLSEVSAALSVPLQQQCSCSLSVHQSLFSCLGTTDSQVVVFLAQLSYTALPGVDMPSLVTSWVTSTPRIAVASTQLQVDSTCPVVIDFLQHESCTAATIAPPTEPPSDVTLVVVAVSVCATLVVVTVTIVIAVTVFCRKQSKYRPNRPIPNPVYNECEYMDSASGGVVLANMTRNPSYVTAREVTTSFTSDSEEAKDVDHMYEMLPFEPNVGGQKCTTDSGQRDATDGDQEATAKYNVEDVYAN